MQTDDLRHRILEATLALGTEHGAEGITMRGLAARLGISTTALYQHFDSKAAILDEIRRTGLSRLAERLRAARDVSDDPAEQVTEMARAYVRFARDNPWLYTVLADEDAPEWKSLLEAEARAFLEPLEVVREALREGVRRGSFRADLDPTTAAYELWAVVHGIASLLRTGRISEKHPSLPIADTDQFVDGYLHHALRGIIS
ncbi:MAG: TetR/AcrR family transcriptional regulator [Deltaproteobacteria bacterium]|nr:MAG: TetR/AcrR family transcriptional regulator [Deltaproteobacteria bacterium]